MKGKVSEAGLKNIKETFLSERFIYINIAMGKVSEEAGLKNKTDVL